MEVCIMFNNNLKVPEEDILRAFEAFEDGATIVTCISKLGISRRTWYAWTSGLHRVELKEKHLQKYPNGKIAKCKCTNRYNR